jgi:hypothetical protein
MFWAEKGTELRYERDGATGQKERIKAAVEAGGSGNPDDSRLAAGCTG